MTEPTPEESAIHVVGGERTTALVNAVRGMQSRMSSTLAAGLMILLGVSALTWYYAQALSRQGRARAAAQSTAANRAQGEMPLPPLGRIVPPPTAAASTLPQGVGVDAGVPVAEQALMEAHPAAGSDVPVTAAAPERDAASAAGPGAKTPAEIAHERRVAGAVFTRVADSTSAVGASVQAEGAGIGGPAAAATNAPAAPAAERSDSALATLLRPSVAEAVRAQVLQTTRFLLPKGAFIDCTLETAIDSSLPGMTTCITAADTFSADGKVVLLERGTKLVGETRGQVQQGQARVFVLWSQARTPQGVVVPLDSPGTDELGRSGLPGQVQRHFWERFGAAMLVSVVDGAVQAGVQASNRSSGTVVYAPSASQDVLTEVLKDTLNIPPTVIKRNGDRIQILVARDLDFRPVYELHASTTGR
jgi:type IV secretion system protein VirB10